MAVINITMENYTDYPKGTEVEFFFGAYYPRIKGIVTGYDIYPATNWQPAGIMLNAEYVCVETDEIIKTNVARFTDTGIGVYLL